MTRIRVVPIVLLAALALALLLGCSTRKGKIMGNERLLRGPEGLGETTRDIAAPDRDTFVSPNPANQGPTLVVGIDQAFEGRSFFGPPPAWGIPDTSDVGVAVLSITFAAPIDVDAQNNGSGLSVTLATTATEYDSTQAWPGPLQALTLGSLMDASSAPFQMSLPSTVLPVMEGWAAAPATFPGIVLYPTSGNGLIGLQAGKATITVVYSRDIGGGTRDTVSVVTSFPNDYYLHPPRAPAPTGSDATLVLGGLFELGVQLRFPTMAVPEGSTVNEATLRLHVDPASPTFATGQKTLLEVRRIPHAWLETATDTTGLNLDGTVFATSDSVAVTSSADSVLVIALPRSIVREWTAAGAINEGILLTVPHAARFPEIRFGSRESSMPAELRVSITTPPPGRF